MSIDYPKKQRELSILMDALRVARARGGESRRLVDRISGNAVAREAPDFVIEPSGGAGQIVGVEHFRVDHLCEWNRKGGHYDSLAGAEQRRMASLQASWTPSSLQDDIPKRITDEVGFVMARCLEAHYKATYRGYIRSFQDAFEKHLGKAGVYLHNVQKEYPLCNTPELAFLVELHSDFSGIFLNEGALTTRPKAGGFLLFKDVRA